MLKRIIALLFILTLTLSSAKAEMGEVRMNNFTLPDDIAAVFAGEEWAEYTPEFPMNWYIVEDAYEKEFYYPVIMKKGEQNLLCMLTKEDGSWAVAFTCENALYHGSIVPNSIDFYIHEADDIYADEVQRLSIAYDYYPPVDDREAIYFHYTIYSGEWKLRLVQIFHPDRPGSYVGGMDYRESTM